MFRTLGARVIRDAHKDFRMNVSRTVQIESQETIVQKKGMLLETFCTGT
jgi:hypothetical protein